MQTDTLQPLPNLVPKSHVIWILISTPIIIYECFFLLLRPETMKGGPLFSYFQSFDTYIQIDPLFGDTENWFVTVLIIFNFTETILNIIGLLMYSAAQTLKTRYWASGVLMFVAAASFYKTLIFLAYDFYYFNWEYNGGWINVVFVYVLPNLCWIIFPLMGMIRMFGNIIEKGELKERENEVLSKSKKIN